MASLAYTNNATNLTLLQQMFASATREASMAMCRWTDSPITLTLDNVREYLLTDAYLEPALDNQILTMVVLNLDDELGTMVLMFTEQNGRQLASSLLHTPPSDDPDWTEMETSALAETGNILSCAYADAITRLIDRPLVPSVPHIVRDYGLNVLKQVMTARALDRNTVLVCRTGFHCDREALNWHVLFIPTLALRTAMESCTQSKV